MDPFTLLPPEILELVFTEIVVLRTVVRSMRIRVVNRLFKTFIDSSIIRLGLMGRDDCGGWYEDRKWLQPDVPSFFHTYAIYQVLQKRIPTTRMGRIRRAAQAICEKDGDAGYEAVSACVGSLVRLAIKVERDNVLGLLEDGHEAEYPNEELDADVYIAAIYLNKQSYVESLIANGIEFCAVEGRSGVHSRVFGEAFYAARMQGNLGMIKLLISCIPKDDEGAILLADQQRRILVDASRTTVIEGQYDDIYYDSAAINKALFTASSPEYFERLYSIQLEDPDDEGPGGLLYSYVNDNKVDMVRHVLQLGATPEHRDLDAALALLNCDEELVRLLVEAGADSHINTVWSGELGALVMATWSGNLSIVKLVLSRVTDVDAGNPAPIALAILKERLDIFRLLRGRGARLDTPSTGGAAMAIAKAYGLTSMIEVLENEGLGRDSALHWTPRSDQWLFPSSLHALAEGDGGYLDHSEFWQQ
ncbi:hypothetical protein ONZ43_g4649 [Nemania bipapillata]|uniref:Uncharacterized protein n=1 Tax=Nemania bipapillata TaxID=110536 RepID=A0ACC2IK36_9PEZI|nr:hypothetical protein ONZ43_g4649 [Nemania bipapillata]